jgi:hypothetical protein
MHHTRSLVVDGLLTVDCGAAFTASVLKISSLSIQGLMQISCLRYHR